MTVETGERRTSLPGASGGVLALTRFLCFRLVPRHCINMGTGSVHTDDTRRTDAASPSAVARRLPSACASCHFCCCCRGARHTRVQPASIGCSCVSCHAAPRRLPWCAPMSSCSRRCCCRPALQLRDPPLPSATPLPFAAATIVGTIWIGLYLLRAAAPYLLSLLPACHAPIHRSHPRLHTWTPLQLLVLPSIPMLPIGSGLFYPSRLRSSSSSSSSFARPFLVS